MDNVINQDVFSPDYYEDILISPRRTEEFIRNRGMKKVVSPFGAAVLLSASIMPSAFIGWQSLVGGMPGEVLHFAAIIGVLVISFLFLFASTEMGYVFPYAGGAYAFARQETGVLGGYVAGMSVVVIQVSLAAISIHHVLDALIYFVNIYQAYGLLILFIISSVALAVWRTDYYFIFLQLLFCGGLAAVSLFIIACWNSGLVHLPRLAGNYFNSPVLLTFTVVFLLSGLSGFACLGEELVDKKRHWRSLILSSFSISIFVLLLMIMISWNTGIVHADDTFMLNKIILAYYPYDHVLQSTFAAFSICAYLLPFVTGLYYASRQLYALSRAGYFPIYFSRLFPKLQTPVQAIMLAAVIIFAVIFIFEINEFISFAVYSFCMEIILVLFSWWLLLKKEPDIFSFKPVVMRYLLAVSIIAQLFIYSLLSIELFPGIYKTIIMWFILILFVYYRGARYIRDEAPEEAAALLKERKKRVDLR